MKLTIIAATGGIGRQILEQATAAGHDVTAVVRDPSRLPSTTARVMTVDLDTDTAALANAVAGADAVLSGLGARTKADEGIATRGTRAIVDAMRATGTSRLVVVSAAPIGTVPSPEIPHPPKHDAGDGFFMRHLFGRHPEGAVQGPLRRPRGDGGRRARQRARLDHRAPAEADRQAADRRRTGPRSTRTSAAAGRSRARTSPT